MVCCLVVENTIWRIHVERIKDFIYDISDIVVSLLIVAIIFLVVSWKLSTSMSMDAVNPAHLAGADNNKTTTQTQPPANASTDSEVIVLDPAKAGTTAPTDAKPTGTTTPTAPQTGTQGAKPAQDLVLEIPSGASGFSIAKQLKEKGLITDTSAFIKRVEELKLGVKLRSGSFTLKTDMTMDQIIYKLTGQTQKQ